MSFLDLTTNFHSRMYLNNQYNLFTNFNTGYSNIFSYPVNNFSYQNIFTYQPYQSYNYYNNIFSYTPTFNFSYNNLFNCLNYVNDYSLTPYISGLTIDTTNPYNIFSYNNPYYSSESFNYPTTTATTTHNDDFLTVTKKRKKKKKKTEDVNINTKDISAWEKIGYSAKKGVQLAKNALSNAVGFTGYCAKFVKNAICKSNLGEYEYGNACDMTAIMRRNKNFKEINPNTVDVNNLPAGCVLVYDKGVRGYSKKYGHTEITDGNGRGISDGISHHLRKPSAIFMPVVA